VDNVVTVTVLADLFGVDRRTVNNLTKRGILVRKARGYPLPENTRRYCDHLRKLATGRGGEGAIATQTAHRARLAKAQADQLELKLAAQRGEVLDAGQVEATWSGIVRDTRNAMLSVPSRCAGRLPHLGKADIAVIDDELRTALTELGTSRD
jgi:terminase small subunit / prophage DNA-packing protein